MKYLLEYNDFIDTFDFSDLVTKETKSRSKPLTEEQFMKIFKENCKNFSFDNTQLYRGNILKADTDFFYIDNSKIRGHSKDRPDDYVPHYQTVDYNVRLKEDPQFKDLPDRNRAIIGSTHPKGAMVTVGNILDEIEEDRTFIMIPFDNVDIAVAPMLDLQAIKRKIKGGKFKRSDFKLLKYTKAFKIPGVNPNHETRNALEIWTEGPCLLVRYEGLKRFKKLIPEDV